jgi:hypothetical protein
MRDIEIVEYSCEYSNPKFVEVPPSDGWERTSKSQFITKLRIAIYYGTYSLPVTIRLEHGMSNWHKAEIYLP